MHAKTAVRLFVALLLTTGAASAQDWAVSLPGTLDRMASSYYLPTVNAAFGTFTFAYTELSSPFSRWFEERLADAAARSRNVKLFNKAAAAAMDPAFRAVYADLFASNEVGALLHGRYYEENDGVRVRIELTGLSDGILIGTAEFRIPKRDIPAGLPVDPGKAAEAAAASLASIVSAGASGGSFDKRLGVSASTDRGAGAVYREGEAMSVLVTVSADAYLKVYHVDVKGAVQLIWPNRFGGGQGLVRAGAAVRIPGEGAPFEFRMTPPYGTEFIKVIASTAPFAGKEGDFADLREGASDNARAAITRGLSVVGTGANASTAGVAGPASMAEATASYVIMEARP
ncbi:MAG: DUF4384 domain-containing protein [Spirochaetes bacterium]|nr:DUF4384 domain-containing protein [Spirochaetota bacterium]